jgi:hypothetical protein
MADALEGSAIGRSIEINPLGGKTARMFVAAARK